MDVGLCIDTNSGLIEPNMPQNFQPCNDSNFHLLGKSTDRAQNFDMKVPPEVGLYFHSDVPNWP